MFELSISLDVATSASAWHAIRLSLSGELGVKIRAAEGPVSPDENADGRSIGAKSGPTVGTCSQLIALP